MGASNSIFTEDQLEEYQELTYFTKKEIVHVYKRFAEICPQNAKDPSGKVDVNRKIPYNDVVNLEELKVGVIIK